MFTDYKNTFFNEEVLEIYRKNGGRKHLKQHLEFQFQQQPEQNIYYNEMKPILIMLRICGRFPYSFTKKGFAQFSFISWSFIYSIVFNLVFGLITFWSMQIIMKDKIYPSQNYDERVFWLLFFLFGIQNFTGPFTFWLDASRIVTYFHKWKLFEDFWRCGNMYSAKRHRFTRIFSISLVPVVLLLIIYEILTLPKLSIIIFLPHIPIVVSLMLVIVYWSLTLHDLTQYSEKLLISMYKVDNRREIDYMRRAWLEIANLVSEIGYATGSTALSTSINDFIGFILSTYGILINLANPDSTKIPVLSLIVPAVACATTAFLKANAAHKATEQIGPEFIKKLLLIDLSYLPRSCFNEVTLMINCISAKSPIIEYLGFIKITRKNVLQFVSYAVTYLIVLVQMKTQLKPLKNDVFPDSHGNSTG